MTKGVMKRHQGKQRYCREHVFCYFHLGGNYQQQETRATTLYIRISSIYARNLDKLTACTCRVCRVCTSLFLNQYSIVDKNTILTECELERSGLPLLRGIVGRPHISQNWFSWNICRKPWFSTPSNNYGNYWRFV